MNSNIEKLKLSGQNLSRVFNFRHGRVSAQCTSFTTEKLPSLKLKTRPKQLYGSLPLAFELPGSNNFFLSQIGGV